MRNRLSIIIPIFNEYIFLKKFFIDIFSSFNKDFVEYILVNDGSFDGSEEWIKKFIKPIANKKFKKILINNSNLDFKITKSESKNNFSDIQIINHKKNQGKGAAVINGLKISTGKYLMILDSDLEYDPKDSKKMFDLIREMKMGEVIFGSRFTSDLPHHHRYYLGTLFNHINTFLFNILFDRIIGDIHCGTKIFTREVYKNIKLTSKDFSIDLDLGSQIAKAGYNISEVGISYYSRSYSEGKKITWVDGLLHYWYLFKFRFIKNDFKRSLMLILAVLTSCLVCAHFGHGSDKILLIIFGVIFGAIFGTRYFFGGLLSLILGLLIGSQFGGGDGKIFTIIIGGLLGVFFAKKIDETIKKIDI